MGIFSKVKKTVKSLAKNPTNLRSIADLGVQSLTFGQADTHGINGLGSLDDILMGKKAKDIPPDQIADMIRASQMKGIGELNSTLDAAKPEDLVNQQVNLQKKSILTSAQDARRNAQTMMARTGLKNSSLGLGLNRSIDQDTGSQVASLNASVPGMIQDMKINNAAKRINLAGLGTGAGINYDTIEGQRSGGIMGIASTLAPLAGTAAGAYKDYQTGNLASKRAGVY